MIGKIIGDSLYAHRDYIDEAVKAWRPQLFSTLQKAKAIIKAEMPNHNYVVVKVRDNRSVSFIDSPDFDTAEEPISGDAYLVRGNGSVMLTHQAQDPWIYHGKHLMVGPDYKGFRVDEAEEWYRYWNKEFKGSHSRIGQKSVWDKVKPKRKTSRTEIGETR